MRKHHRVELVAVEHHQPAAVGGVVERRAADLDAAEIEPGELAEHLVVIAGDIDDPRAALGALEDAPDDVVVRRGPVELLLQPPAVDDVADQVHRLAVDIVEEVDQHLGVAALGAEMDVGDPDRAVLAAASSEGSGSRLGSLWQNWCNRSSAASAKSVTLVPNMGRDPEKCHPGYAPMIPNCYVGISVRRGRSETV